MSPCLARASAMAARVNTGCKLSALQRAFAAQTFAEVDTYLDRTTPSEFAAALPHMNAIWRAAKALAAAGLSQPAKRSRNSLPR